MSKIIKLFYDRNNIENITDKINEIIDELNEINSRLSRLENF